MSRVTNHDELLNRVTERARHQSDGELSCATQEQIREAEAMLGFPLPPLLARLYQEVGNGGFGPDYQLLPLIGSEGRTVVGAYREEQKPGRWPTGILPVLDWGCGMYAAIDCTSSEAPVLLFEPNAVDDDWSTAWFLDAESLSDWLQTWLSDAGWYMEEAATSDDFSEPQPWHQARQRLS
ncbi:SMI1/KNR4 family protein [Actinomadura montaniterrae]|uniref:SMI1/KNR4 family protein n=1 Tax=Actinomadura montaniterrae TaxID=1803903 RepID=A0A6L3VX83_9ACTN|nr:SMI1/KNR4 family protein [Actinomadura montaniterrae]KAB2376922.1 SMI1/KNR4 family protein [Actinomadura montaniterrae]